MNNLDFAGRLARIAQKAATCSADQLQPAHKAVDRVVTIETVLWFTNDVRAMLDKMERDAGGAA